MIQTTENVNSSINIGQILINLNDINEQFDNGLDIRMKPKLISIKLRQLTSAQHGYINFPLYFSESMIAFSKVRYGAIYATA